MKTLPFVTTLMNYRDIMLSEVNGTERQICKDLLKCWIWKTNKTGTSLVVQWSGLCASNAGDADLDTGGGN